MNNNLDNSELDSTESAKRFLLGNVSESERAEIEDRFLADDDFFQELLIGEDEMIDAYVRGELPAPERARFEQKLSTSQHLRERVEFAQTLFNSVSSKAVTAAAATIAAGAPARHVSWWRSWYEEFFVRRPALGFTLAAVSLVIVLGSLWLLTDRGQTRPAPQQQAQTVPTATVMPRESPTPASTAEPPTRDAENSNRAPVRETPRRTAPVIATFTLLPGLERSETGSGALVLPAGTTEVRLRLMLESGDSKQYRATLTTAEGRNLWSRTIAKGRSNKYADLTLNLPANLLKSDDYILDLSSINPDGKWESVADYSFRIVKK